MIKFRVFKFPPDSRLGEFTWCTQDYFYCNLTFHKTWEEAMSAAEILGRMYSNRGNF